MRLFDTHAHLDDPQLAVREDDVISSATDAAVHQIVAIGTDVESSRNCIDIADRNPGVFAAVGIHPNGCHLATENDWAAIVKLAQNRRAVAIGETGLDCYWDDTPLATQIDWFARHIQLSHESGKPLVVHMRESESEILQAFDQHHQNGHINGIMHSFTGSPSTAARCLDLGMYISFAGMVTFKNAHQLREVAREIPLDRMLIETDSPYLTPHPHRGKRPNEPRYLVHTAQCLADLREISLEEFARTTTSNARRLFGLSDE